MDAPFINSEGTQLAKASPTQGGRKMEEKKEETGTGLFHQFTAQGREPEEEVVCVKLIK